jgi:hypothetical protein
VAEDTWGDIIESASLRAVWKGHFEVSDEPSMTMWWQAWNNVAGGQDIMHVGVSCFPGEDVYGEGYKLAQRMLTGILNMCWKSVGGELKLETYPLMQTKVGANGLAWVGKVVVRANSGKQFDPLMIAIQETRDLVEKT